MDRRLSVLAILIFLISTLLLLDDMRVILLPWLKYGSKNSSPPIGKFKILHNAVKQRAQNELLWSRSAPEEDIHFYDSVLTLSESFATLELNNKSRLEVSENTLIVFEPPADGNLDSLRMRFAKGQLRAKALQTSTSIISQDVELKLDTGATFQLKGSGDGELQFEVKDGSATILSSGQAQKIGPNELAQISKNKIEKTKIDDSLSWSKDKIRVYTRNDTEPVKLNWNGTAEAVEVRDNARTEKISTQNSNELEIQFTRGTHSLLLRSTKGVSSQLTVEVIEAPVIHLYSPLPRERVGLNEDIHFYWPESSDFTRYQIEFSENTNFESIIRTEETGLNTAVLKFDQPIHLFWRVRGIDREGFSSPTTYSNELYIIDKPLEAPGTNEPRTPAQDKEGFFKPFERHWFYSFLKLGFSFFFQVAEASEDVPPLRFEWEPVREADSYSLEIDDDKYFQSPEVITSVKQSHFEWSKAPKQGVFYWRVAGDKKGGKMGRFSEVQKIDLAQIPQRTARLKKFEVYRKIASEEIAPLPQSTPLPPAKDEIPPAPNEPAMVEAPPVQKHNWRVAYGFGYGYHDLTSQPVSHVKMQGLEGFNLFTETVQTYESTSARLSLDYRTSSWKVANTSKYPFQKDLTTSEYGATVMISGLERALWTGISLRSALSPQRVDFEEMTVTNKFIVGPAFGMDSDLGSQFYNEARIDLLVSDSETGVWLSNHFFKKIPIAPQINSLCGLRLEGNTRSIKNSSSTTEYRGLLNLGIDW